MQPNIDLHCHLDGSLSLEFLQRALGDQITETDIEVSDQCTSLPEYLSKFDLPLEAMQTEKQLTEAAYDFIKTAAEDHMDYIEARFAPMLSLQKGLSAERVIESVLRGMEQGRQEYQVDYNLIVCAMRHHSYEQNLSMLRSARLFLGEGVCAADLAGDESSYPMAGFCTLFEEVRKMELPFTIHAGECGSAENIAEAVETGASRIGHGIAMSGNEKVQELCRMHAVGIEMCPISNLQTKAASLEQYPMEEFLDAGLLVTINTDNRTVSNTSMDREVQFVREHFGIRQDQIKQMADNAIRVAYADDSVKERLYKKLRQKSEK